MKKQKYLVSVVCGILIVGGLAGCSMAAKSGGAPAAPDIPVQESGESPDSRRFQTPQESPEPQSTQIVGRRIEGDANGELFFQPLSN